MGKSGLESANSIHNNKLPTSFNMTNDNLSGIGSVKSSAYKLHSNHYTNRSNNKSSSVNETGKYKE